MALEAKQSMVLRGGKVDCFRFALRQTGCRCGAKLLRNLAVVGHRKRLLFVAGHDSELNRRELQWRPSTL
jgi:hypothetical protein